MRVGFAGTPEFARAILRALKAAAFDIVLVLTQPDRPTGRGLKLHPSAVKAYALERGIPVEQPRSLRLDGRFPDDAFAVRGALFALRPDVMVVAAYGLLLPAWVLALPRHGCLNVHASLLPRWRGAAPIQRAIEAGDSLTGITIMQMDAGLDTGDMLMIGSVPIDRADSTSTLQDRLTGVGGRLIVQALEALRLGALRGVPQPDSGVSYARKIDKAEAPIDWSAPAQVIERRIRAFDPFPGATGVLNGETLKFWRAEVAESSMSSGALTGPPGEILAVDTAGVTVACGRGALRLSELQRSGGKRLAAREFLAGHALASGTRFAPRAH